MTSPSRDSTAWYTVRYTALRQKCISENAAGVCLRGSCPSPAARPTAGRAHRPVCWPDTTCFTATSMSQRPTSDAHKALQQDAQTTRSSSCQKDGSLTLAHLICSSEMRLLPPPSGPAETKFMLCGITLTKMRTCMIEK